MSEARFLLDDARREVEQTRELAEYARPWTHNKRAEAIAHLLVGIGKCQAALALIRVRPVESEAR